MDFVVDKLIDFSSNKDEELRDISSLGSVFNLEAYLFFDHPVITNSSQNDHSRTPPGKPNCTKSLRQTITEALTPTFQCKHTPYCLVF